jgi:hypothetical protein
LRGIIEFAMPAVLGLEPIRVFYSAPTTAPIDVLVVMTGRLRNAHQYLDDFAPYTEPRNVLLLVPEFPNARFTGSRNYNLGAVMTKRGAYRRREEWLFSLIEPMVAHAQSTLCARTAPNYCLYGHSAGAQFTHRFVLLGRPRHLRRAVAANAGWYTLPHSGAAYPYGVARMDVSPSDLRRSLGSAMTVLLGEADTDATDFRVRHDQVVDRQGENRLERGYYFIEQARIAAAELATDLGWSLVTVPGAAHFNTHMIETAVDIMFGGSDRVH